MISLFRSSVSKSNDSPSEIDLKQGQLLLILGLLFGTYFRFIPTLQANFVINDGGLFYLFAKEIRSHNFALPALVPYATEQPAIPFCYPPLAFYAMALLNLFGISFEWSLRFLPALFSVATIWAVWRLGRTIFQEMPRAELLAGLSAFFIAFTPRVYQALIMGGGITRAPSLFFAILAVERVITHWRDGDKKALWQASLLFGVTLLIHLERARFLVFAVFLVWLVYQRKTQGVKSLGLFLLGGLLISSPWWGVCIARFGLAPFMAAYGSGSGAWSKPSIIETLLKVEPSIPVLTTLAICGLLIYWKKLPFLLVWCLTIAYFEVRSGSIFLTIPLSMGLALTVSRINPKLLRKTSFAAIALWSSFLCLVVSNNCSNLYLHPSQIEAMQWCSKNAPVESKFLVIPYNPNRDWRKNWPNDLVQEWFPAYAHRASLLTVQGTEWLEGGVFKSQIARYAAVSSAANWLQMQKRLAKYSTTYDWIYLPKAGTGQPRFYSKEIERQIRMDKAWQVAFENQEVIIFSQVKQVVR